MFAAFIVIFFVMMIIALAGRIIVGPKRAAGYDRAVLATFRWLFIGGLTIVVLIVAVALVAYR